jgi:site-specific DNA-methyltransferase (adenine-specific)
MTLKPDWQQNDISLFCGDAEHVLRRLPAGMVDAVITDPPFFLPAQHYASRAEDCWTRCYADLSILRGWFEQIVGLSQKVAGKDSHHLFFCDAQSYPVFYEATYSLFPRSVCLVWNKERIGMGRPWRHQHELILACSGTGATLTDTQGTVLSCKVVPTSNRIHPAEKPIELLQRLVTLMPGETIGDWFMGSGATAEAAIRSGKRFVGIEKDAKYFAEAVQRVEQVLAETIDHERPMEDRCRVL